jgi:acetyltransferase-like isoleucine patch superfamily enzyme
MTDDARSVVIPTGTAESRAFAQGVERAMALTHGLNRLAYADQDAIWACFAELTGAEVPEGFRLIPPFFTDGGRNIRVGRHVFVNQNCTIYDLAPVTIGDEVLIGPNVSLITTSHPVAPSRRLAELVAEPIDIGANVWIATGATVIGGVTIGEHSVVAAGSVVTGDVPAATLVGGNPARVIRSIAGE